jgi:poly(A)-specific ribonuclease
MDINNENFKDNFLDMLFQISSSEFVTISIQTSGAAPKPDNKGGPETLQMRYLATRAAARKYQVLQLGITCVQAIPDQPSQTFNMVPYNITITPVVSETLPIDRSFSMQSSRLAALHRVGFELSGPFDAGVPYISRAEELEARRLVEAASAAYERRAPAERLDDKDRAFVGRVRAEIQEWLVEPEALAGLRIVSRTTRWRDMAPPRGEDGGGAGEPLTARDMRIVCALLDDEFPGLYARAAPGGGGLVVDGVALGAEAGARGERRAWRARNRVSAEVGVRWLVEALVGGERLGAVTVEDFPGDCEENRARLKAAVANFADRRPVVVGHGLFEQIAFLCENFLWELPDTVARFADMVSRIWPMVVDTEYVVSQWFAVDGRATASLDFVEAALSEEEEPVTCKSRSTLRSNTSR